MPKILVAAVAAYALYCAALFLLQRQMLFPRHLAPAPGPKQEPAPTGISSRWIEYPGGRVEAWFLPPGAGARPAPAMIFAHGNAERIDDLVPEFLPFSGLGIGVLLVEYPGYGRSPGAPSQATITAAMTAAYDDLVSRPGVDPARVVLYGRSLGGGAVCALAARRPSAAMILASSFTSVRSFARRYGLPGFLVRDPFDNLAVVRRYGQPLLVVHGRRDEVIPFAHGEALFRAAPQGRLLAWDCGHNDCPPDGDRFLSDLADFLGGAGIPDRRP